MKTTANDSRRSTLDRIRTCDPRISDYGEIRTLKYLYHNQPFVSVNDSVRNPLLCPSELRGHHYSLTILKPFL